MSVAYTDVGQRHYYDHCTSLLAFSHPLVQSRRLEWNGGCVFAGMGKNQHMQFFGVYSGMDIINFCLPPFLLVLGDANMYQRFFASKDAKGAKSATKSLVFAVVIIELLIIASAWVSASMIPDAEVGKHVLIYAAHRFLPTFLGAIMMTTIVGIIISTADSYLLVPATTLMRDIYLNYNKPQSIRKRKLFY